jgi:hypothetical protein
MMMGDDECNDHPLKEKGLEKINVIARKDRALRTGRQLKTILQGKVTHIRSNEDTNKYARIYG